MLRGRSALLEGGGSAVTHLVIEGGDIELRRQWEEAVAQEMAERAAEAADSADSAGPAEAAGEGAAAAAVAAAAGGGFGGGGDELRVMVVEPRAWRRALLSPKEQKTGKLAKAAARLIARQVVAGLG